MHARRFLLTIGLLAAAASGQAADADLRPRQLLPAKAALIVEVESVGNVLRHPLVRDGWAALSRSSEVQRQMTRPEFDRVDRLRTLLKGDQEDWIAGLSRLTQGGAAFSLVGGNGTPPEAMFVLRATDEATLRKTLDAAQAAALERIPAERRPARIPSEPYRGIPCYTVGEVRYAHIRQWLLASNRPKALHAAIDRLMDGPTPSPRPENLPEAKVELDLAAWRSLPEVGKALEIPTDDAGRIFALAGWIDLLRRADRATAELRVNGPALELVVGLDAGRTGATPGLAGFFATESQQRAAPPLVVPELIASFSWSRDYAAMWRGRSSVLTDSAREKVDEGDAMSRRQLEVVGGRFTLSELVSHLGTRFRFVAARQKSSAYRKVELSDKLPAAAICVDLRDEKFQELVQPLLRFAGLIAAADGRRMVTQIDRHRQSTLTSFRWREDAETQARGGRIRYQFSPTYAFAHRHFVVGTTTEIVTQLIDALEEEALQRPADVAEGVTEQSLVSARQLGAALADFRGALETSSVLESGLPPNLASNDLNALVQALEAVGMVRSTLWIEDRRFEAKLTVGEPLGR